MLSEEKINDLAKEYANQNDLAVEQAFKDGYKTARRHILESLERGACTKYDKELATIMRLYQRIDFDAESEYK